MRSAFSKSLPEQIAWRKDKIGYEPPQKKWLDNIDIKEKIQLSKKKLYDNQVISKVEYENDIVPAGAFENGKAWALWMAGNLF